MPRALLFQLLNAIEGKEPPDAFIIFRPGVNTTLKGDFLFDAAASKELMAAYVKHGTRIMIDWDHLSVNPKAPKEDRAASGWCDLELRSDGSLWACNVKWTAKGAQAIRDGEWIYTSPYFATDGKNRPVFLMNIALTNIPATDNLDALIAASVAASTTENTMLEKIAAALGLPPEATEDDILAAISAMCEKASVPAEAAPAVEAAAQLCALTGKATPRAALAMVSGLLENKASTAALSARVAELEGTVRQRDFDSVVKEGEQSGRLHPGNKARVLGKANGDPVALSGILEEITPDPRLAAPRDTQPGTAAGADVALSADIAGKRWGELTPSQKHRLANDNPALARSLRAVG